MKRQTGPVYSLCGQTPKLGTQVFIAPTAAVIGNVSVGAGSSVWFSAVVRGDDMPVTIGESTNIQDGAVVHSTEDVAATVIGNRVVIGHGAMLHGCTVEDEALIGIGAIILDGAIIGARAVVAAGALVPPGKVVPSGALWIGNPGRVARDAKPEERAFVAYAAHHYQNRAKLYLAEGIGPDEQ
jgi:gamma-carbonic anhydrase